MADELLALLHGLLLALAQAGQGMTQFLFAAVQACANAFCTKHPDGTACRNGDGCVATAECQAGTCVAKTGKPDGAPCENSDGCQSDVCEGGTCKSCKAAGPCEEDGTCSAGACQKKFAVGRACDDANTCTENDACDAKGACRGVKRGAVQP